MNNRDELRRALIQELMTRDSADLVEWKGRRISPAEVLQDMMRDDGVTVHTGPRQDQQHQGSGIEPSQGALDQLSPEHYAALQKGAGIEGLTAPIPQRVHWRSGEVITVRMKYDHETGKIEHDDGLDLTHFHDPADRRDRQ